MTEEQFPKSALDKFRQWHFWWLMVFSFLLIITFVYYLPTRFLQQVGTPHDDPMGMPIDESQPHGHDSAGNSIPPAGQGSEHMMTNDQMHAHMEEHMEGGMSMDTMMTHMMEMHDMTKEEADSMMDEMMGHAGGAEEADHGHEGAVIEEAGQTEAGEAQYYEEAGVKQGLAVNLNISPVPYNAGALLSMNFFVNQKPGNIPVPADKLQVEHEKLMHVIGVRSDMSEFFHVHPDFLADNTSVFSINRQFNKPGLYKIWSEIKKDGINYSFGHPEVNINGQGAKEEKIVSFSRNVITGDYQVSMTTGDTAVKGRQLDVTFDIHTLTGQEIDVEPYLGADMHLSIIRDDRKQFIHTHPAGSHAHTQSPGLINMALAHGGEEPAGATDQHQTDAPSADSGRALGGDEVISFNVTFPEAGLYKAFAQFRPKGIDLPVDQALLAEFWIQVEEKATLPISQWWGLLLVSVILIAGLSWWVNGYLKVKPEDVAVKK